MGSKYKEWNSLLCDMLCEEMRCLEENPNSYEQLKVVKEVSDTIVNLQEIEVAGAMRKFAHEKYGYNSDSGQFEDWEESEEYFPQMYNAYQRRDNRGRFAAMNRGSDGRMRNAGYPDARDGDMRNDYLPFNPIPPIYNNDGRQPHSIGDGRYMDDGKPYMLRQEDGRPVKSRIYNAYDPHMHGFKMTDEMYKGWLKELENADGSSGAKWSKEETTMEAKKNGIEFKQFTEMEFCMAMNMMYSDYCGVAAKFGVDNAAFYACLAKAFLEDEDANVDGGDKLAAYYKAIVE